MPKCGRAWQALVLPSQKEKNLVSSVVTRVALILACCCKDTLSQKALSYTLTVSQDFYVERKSCIHIPCRFTYNSRDASWNENLSAYWLKIQEGERTCFSPGSCFPGLGVATTDTRQTNAEFAKNRFHFIGDPNQGNCSVVITNAQAEDDGQYYLRIEGKQRLKYSYLSKNGHISPYIHVIDRPQGVEISGTIERPGLQSRIVGAVVAQEGDTVMLQCAAVGARSATLTWTKGNSNYRILSSGREYVISQIKPEDSGEYRCEVENRLGSASKTIRVTVQYPPKTVTLHVSRMSRSDLILSRDFPQEVLNGSQLMAQAGDSLHLLCKVESNPPARTRWIKGGREASADYAENSLKLAELTVEDEGEYVCHATNSLGSAQGTFQLYVADAPMFSEDPQRNTTCWHEDNGFLCSCSFKGRPPPQIHWLVDGEIITEKNQRRNLNITSFTQGDEVTSTLNWTGSVEVDHNIICTGNNSFGIYRMQFLLNAWREPITADPSTGSHTVALVSMLSGVLLAASFFALGLFLLKFYKTKAPPRAGCDGIMDPTNVVYREPTNNSLIYSNILPVGQRSSPVVHPQTAGQKNVKPGQIPKAVELATGEADELHYAALEFKLNNAGVSAAKEESVEYSAIRRK